MLDRFWAKVDKTDRCWEWTAARVNGYGVFRLPGTRRNIGAHRYSYELLVGPIPEGLEIDHLCRNRGCVNPDHLEPVTRRVNTLRGVSSSALNAAKTHCKHGHPFDKANTCWDRSRGRACRTCHVMNIRKHRERVTRAS